MSGIGRILLKNPACAVPPRREPREVEDLSKVATFWRFSWRHQQPIFELYFTLRHVRSSTSLVADFFKRIGRETAGASRHERRRLDLENDEADSYAR
jgi:hypothetical protein